jgi:NitT/TauT family transport system substrate-binding protein
MMMFQRLFLLTLPLLLVACGSGGPAASGLEEGELMHIRLPMGFVADPQYAPIYVADSRGYYAEEGFSLEFDYSFETEGIALVGAGELPFAIVSGEQVILARAQDLPVVYITEWFQRFAVAVISKAEAGIVEPADLAGREVGLPALFGASYVGYAGLLQASGLSLDDMEIVDIGFTQVEALLADRVEAVVGYVSNEPIRLADMGVAVNVIDVGDYADLVANGIITNETLIAEEPEMVEGFVRATLRGLADTLADPRAAYEICKEYVEGLDDSRYPVLEASLKLWQAETLGLSEGESWQRTQEVLLSLGFLDWPLDNLDVAYTNQFVLAVQDDLD